MKVFVTGVCGQLGHDVMNELRKPADELEMIVDKNIWPIPTYGELMFEV